MKITFSNNKEHLLFLHEDASEAKKLSRIPAFSKIENYHTCPAVVPIAYNLIARLKLKFKNINITEEVVAWINQPFKLLPIPQSFKYHTTPKDFQEIALRFLYTLGSAGILLDPGMGKSKVILDYIFLKDFKKSLIVCPAALLFVWEDEIKKHRPELNFYIVKSTDWEVEQEKIAKISGNVVIILNYDKAVILKHRLKEFKADFIHLDEFLIKDPSTNRTQSLTEIGRRVPFRAGGSGTLVNNSPLDTYCPVRYLQPSLVGWSYSSFFDEYAVTREIKKEGSPSRKMVVAFRSKDEIRSILESCCIVMTKEVWLKLPPKHFHDVFAQMGDDQRAAYYSLLRNYRVEVAGREIEVDNPLVMMSKLYQISQGFLYVAKETEKEVQGDLFATEVGAKKAKLKKSDREVIFFKDQPKIEALKKLLTITLKDRKSIIWFNLDGEYQLIERALTELGESALYIRGGDKALGEKVREFNRNPSIKRLVCQAKAVNYGITVLGTKEKDLDDEMIQAFPDLQSTVSDSVFYSLNFSLEVYLQQQDRIHRLGQEKECNYYRLFVNNPMELKLKQAIADKVILKLEMLVDIAEELLTIT